jgi:zinc/manganese transport system permease protein
MPGPSWNILLDIQQMWSFPFMVNAFRAGAIVAVAAAAMGWFMVLRRQSFAGHTLAVVGFPGASGAALLGLSTTAGYFGFCVAAALLIAAIPRVGRHGHESAATGITQAFALGLGFLFVTLYHGYLDGLNALLFGTFLGVTGRQVLVLGAVTVAVLITLAAIGRPLLFASIDPVVAQAKGVPVRTLSVLFLVLLGAAVAEASQITGSLLVFALLVMPAASAQAITARPLLGLVLSAVIGVVVTWVGLGVAYYSDYPIGFYVTTFAFVVFVATRAIRAGLARSGRRAVAAA